MVFNEKQYLKSEITRLANEGLIDRVQEKAILESYNLKENSKIPLFWIFSLLFIGLSFILLIAHNWKEIPNILKTLLLLSILFGTHYGIFYAKNSSVKQSFGILSGFVLLGNMALLSQIYHLGDDTALAFLSVGVVLLILAFCLKSFVVYLQGYIFAAIGYFLDYQFGIDFETLKLNLANSLILLILLGFITQSGIFFKLSPIESKLLALLNFLLLESYAAKFLGSFSGVWISLMFLGFHFKFYQFYAYIFLAFGLVFFMLNPALIDIWIICALVLLVLLYLANIRFKHYFLSIIALGILTWYVLVGYVGLEFLENPHFAFLVFLFAKPYLIFLLLLGIHCIKENYKILGILILVTTIFYTYIALIENYIVTSAIFLLFGVGLLYYSRRRNAKKV
ncbi:DUF2157 domain-containing protein [Helicobacter apodemus]|uniref:DUF2157 domain-containing protein n=1 Tax=Helicobacter apodemus TaxID=135569 RepID=UPI0013A56869|nr:DUF2157 domain-containing protein [Helicobacter apodemus]